MYRFNYQGFILDVQVVGLREFPSFHREGAKDAKIFKEEVNRLKTFSNDLTFLRALPIFAVKRFVFSRDSFVLHELSCSSTISFTLPTCPSDKRTLIPCG